jgi:hypothetical protein
MATIVSNLTQTVWTRLRILAGRLRSDERGFASALSLIFVTAIVCLGALVGVSIIRNHIVQELGDVAVALDNIDQSFSYEIIVEGTVCWSAEYIDDPATLMDNAGDSPAGLSLTAPPQGENGVSPSPSGDFP